MPGLGSPIKNICTGIGNSTSCPGKIIGINTTIEKSPSIIIRQYFTTGALNTEILDSIGLLCFCIESPTIYLENKINSYIFSCIIL